MTKLLDVFQINCHNSNTRRFVYQTDKEERKSRKVCIPPAHLPNSYLLAVASLLVFSAYRVENGDNVGRTVPKIGRAGNRRLMDVHGVRVLKDRVAARYIVMINYSRTYITAAKKAETQVEDM